MSSLHYQALSGRTRQRRRSSPFVSIAAVMAIAALLALVQSVRPDQPHMVYRAMSASPAT